MTDLPQKSWETEFVKTFFCYQMRNGRKECDGAEKDAVEFIRSAIREEIVIALEELVVIVGEDKHCSCEWIHEKCTKKMIKKVLNKYQ